MSGSIHGASQERNGTGISNQDGNQNITQPFSSLHLWVGIIDLWFGIIDGAVLRNILPKSAGIVGIALYIQTQVKVNKCVGYFIGWHFGPDIRRSMAGPLWTLIMANFIVRTVVRPLEAWLARRRQASSPVAKIDSESSTEDFSQNEN